MKRKERSSGVGRKRSHGRPKKRAKIFYGRKPNGEEKPQTSTAADKKISGDDYDSAGYRLFHIETLFQALREHLCCKECGGAITVTEVGLEGLGGLYGIVCENCVGMKTFGSSLTIEGTNGAYEINSRAILAMRCIGQGFASLATFCGVMDLPPPVQRSTYDIAIEHMVEATTEVANAVFHQAVEEEIEASESPESREITVECDETWQGQGFKSLNSVCTVIGTETGKVVDLEVLSSHCSACIRWKGKQSGEEWERWYEQHREHCQANHAGSSGAMEVNGMVRIFQRSKEKHNAKYIGYIGDGDTKSYAAVVKAEPYGLDIKIKKIERCGHVQKRFGTQMRKVKSRLEKQKLSDGRTLGGKGRLTDVIIDQMQSYYGNVIRNNSDSVENMSRAIWAIWHHESSRDQNPQYHLCPSGENSWCQYNKSIAERTVEHYRHKNPLPQTVIDAIKPVFENLTAPELLIRCVRGKTQNANESLNSVISKTCPKRVHTRLNLVLVAANLEAITFSLGAVGILRVMTALKITPGANARAHMIQMSRARFEQVEQQAVAAGAF